MGFIREEEQAHSRRMRAAALSSPRVTGNHPTATSPPPILPHSPQEQSAIVPAANAATNSSAIATGTSTFVIAARDMLLALPPNQPVGLSISQVSPPAVQLSPTPAAASTTIAQPAGSGDESTAQASQPIQVGASGGTTTTNTAATSNVAAQNDDVSSPTRRPSVSSGGPGAAAPATPDESGSGTGANTGVGNSSSTATGTGSGPSGNGVVTPGTPGGGIIGKLRGFGRTTKRTQNENAPGTSTPTPAVTRATGSTAAPASSTVVATSAASAATSTSTPPSSTPVCHICPRASPPLVAIGD